jgi:hypothetical protein
MSGKYKPIDPLAIQIDPSKPNQVSGLLSSAVAKAVLMFTSRNDISFVDKEVKLCGKCYYCLVYEREKKPFRCPKCTHEIDWTVEGLVKYKQCPKCHSLFSDNDEIVCPYEESIVKLREIKRYQP